jgi:hypothetical protein
MTSNSDDHLPVPTKADRDRLDEFWRAFADRPESLVVNPQNRMDAWVVEQRMIADRRANDRMVHASRLLVWATGLLVLVTLCQIAVTLLR